MEKTIKDTKNYMKWWNYLPMTEKHILDGKYLNPMDLWSEDNITKIYIAEHPLTTETTTNTVTGGEIDFGEGFYNYMQRYRIASTVNQSHVTKCYEDVKEWIKGTVKQQLSSLQAENDKLMGEKIAAIDLIKMDDKITVGLLERLKFLLSKHEVLKAENERLREALNMILNIENAAFGLKGFDSARLKSEIKAALQNK